MPFALPDSRATWIAYYVVISVVTLYFFSDLSGLLLDTCDADYFQDSADALTEPATFFSPDKRMPGRPGLELILLLQYIAWGEDAAAYHLFSGLLHLIAALVLSRTGRAMGLRIWDTKVWIADHNKISRKLGWQPYYPLREGLAHTAEWFAQN